MGIAGEVGQDRLRSGERLFAVDHPGIALSLDQEVAKTVRIAQPCELPVKGKATAGKEFLESVAELRAKHLGKRVDREEVTIAGAFPTRGGKSSSGDDAVEMVMTQQRLAPGVQDGGQADLRLEPALSKLQQRGAGGGEEQIVKRPLVLGDQRIEDVRNREDDVEIRNRQQAGGLLLKPLLGSGALAIGAMPVAAAMRNEVLLAAVFTAVKVSAKPLGSAAQQRVQRLPLPRRKPARTNNGGLALTFANGTTIRFPNQSGA